MDKPKYDGLKMSFKILTQLQLSLSTVQFLISFLTHHLGLSIFDPNLDFRVLCAFVNFIMMNM